MRATEWVLGTEPTTSTRVASAEPSLESQELDLNLGVLVTESKCFLCVGSVSGRQKTMCGNLFSPSTMCALGITLRLVGLVASVFAGGATPTVS